MLLPTATAKPSLRLKYVGMMSGYPAVKFDGESSLYNMVYCGNYEAL
jgi:hypothetical protein